MVLDKLLTGNGRENSEVDLDDTKIAAKPGHEVLDQDFTVEELEQSLENREADLENIHNAIEASWRQYQNLLEQAEESQKLERVRLESKAADYKKRALHLEEVLMNQRDEKDVLASVKHIDLEKKLLEGDHYKVNLSDIDRETLSRKVSELKQLRNKHYQEISGVKKAIRDGRHEDFIDRTDVGKDIEDLQLSERRFTDVNRVEDEKPEKSLDSEVGEAHK